MTYRLSPLRRAVWSLAAAMLLGAAACHGPDSLPAAEGDAASPAPADLARPAPHDLAGVVVDLSSAADLAGMMWPAAMPPPTSCNMRSAGVTAIQGVLRIDEYKGLQSGKNGVHEIAEATLLHTSWVYAAATVDTTNIHLAMNVASAMDRTGLPMEIPLHVGQLIETEGEYIPAAQAGSTNKNGAAAVIHFTHMPCGYAVLGGTTYR